MKPALVWTSDVPPPPVASPAGGDGRCYLLSDGRMVCIDAATGNEKWNLAKPERGKPARKSWKIAQSAKVGLNSIEQMTSIDRLTGAARPTQNQPHAPTGSPALH